MTLDATWPQHPNLQGGFAPQLAEDETSRRSRWSARSRASSPARSTATARTRSSRRAAAMAYHWFDGDGMIHAISLADGRAQLQATAGCARAASSSSARRARALFGGLALDESDRPRRAGASSRRRACRATTQCSSPPTPATRTSSGTRGRLLALLEMRAPTELDPRTPRDPRAVRLFDGKLAGEMTAHPKVDPETGELLVLRLLGRVRRTCATT